MGQIHFPLVVLLAALRSIGRYLAIAMVGTASLVLAVAWILASHDARDKYPVAVGLVLPSFASSTIPGGHVYVKEKALPFMGSAALDVDGDGPPELFLAGGWGRPDRILRLTGGRFVETGPAEPFGPGSDDATYGAALADEDGDGRLDLFLARANGVWLFKNLGAGAFTGRRLALDLGTDSVPLSIAVADLNRDRLPDLYLSCYLPVEQVKGQTIFNDPDYGAVSRLFVSAGAGRWTDETVRAGIFERHNSFQALFTDLDGDGLADLVAARDTGQVRTWRNSGSLKFEPVKNPSTDAFGYPMGIAAADADNDGDIDLFFSNTGSTVPDFMARGDLGPGQRLLKSWIYFRNEGGFSFVDAAAELRLAAYEFSWGPVFADLNNDGRQDLVVAENYVQFPLHAMVRLPGRILIQDPTGSFSAVERSIGAVNRAFEIAPIIADFDGDGALDLVRANLDGPSLYQHQSAPKGHWVALRPRGGPERLGTEAELTLNDGRRLIRRVIQGQGLGSDVPPVLWFGLGEATGMKSLRIREMGGVWKASALPTLDRYSEI